MIDGRLPLPVLRKRKSRLQNTHTVTFDCNRVMVHRAVVPVTAMDRSVIER